MANYAYDQTLGKPVYFDDISAEDVPNLKTHLYTCVECGLPMYLRYGETMGVYWAHGPYTTNSGWDCKLLTNYNPNKSKEKTREDRVTVLKQWYKDKKITMEEVQQAYERLLDLFKESESEALRQVAEANLEKQRLQIALKKSNLESPYRQYGKDGTPLEISYDKARRELEGYRRFVEEEVIFIGKPPSSFNFEGQFMEEVIVPDWIKSPIREKLNYLLENNISWSSLSPDPAYVPPIDSRASFRMQNERYGFDYNDCFDYIQLHDLKRAKTELQKRIANPTNKVGWQVHNSLCMFLAETNKHSDLPSKEGRAKELSFALRDGESNIRDFYCKEFIKDVIEYIYDAIMKQKNSELLKAS